jgi:hypothetical protein
MDLPSCPSCGQSVLDDDVVDCPFCGASMSGKARSKSLAPAKATVATGSGTGTGTGKSAATAKAGSGAASDPANDDPFDVAAPVTGKVIQLLPKPSKGRLHRIGCPMCETAGFSSKKAAGKEVKCANRECLVPIFTAPPLEDERPVEPEAKAKSGLGIVHYVVIAVVTAAVLGGGAWYLTNDQPAGGAGAEFDQNKVNSTGVVVNGGTPTTSVEITTDPGEVVAPPVVLTGPPASELRAEALKLIVAFSLDAEVNQKPYCRRLAAEAWARQGAAGNDAVNEQLAQLQKTGGERMAYQRLLPLIEVAWQNFESGDAAVAGNIIDGFPRLIEKLPPQGMLALDTVTELAVLQAALDRMDDAAAVIASRSDAGSLGQLMESLARARFTGTPFDQAVALRPTLGSSDPQAVAVTVGLTARGLSEKALAWADRAANSTECVAAWGETLIARAGSAAPLTQILQRGESLSPADRVRFLSRIGVSLRAAGATTEAQAQLKAASELLAGLGTPQPLPLSDLKKQVNYIPPDKSALRRAALAALDLAQLELNLNGREAAWKTVQTALVQTRGISPSLTDARQPYAEIRRIGDAGVTRQLRALHGLLTDDDAKNAYVLYQARCQRLVHSATVRFALQERILTSACEWGLVDQVWTEIRARATESDLARNEPWFETHLTDIVHDWFKHSQQEEQRAEVERLALPARPENNRKLSARRYLTGLVAEQLLADGRVENLAPLLERFAREFPQDRRWQQETILRSASQLVQAGNAADALKFAESLRDLQIRHEVCELVSAEITASGERELILKHVKLRRMTPADRVALLRGYLERLPDDPPPPPPTPSDESGSET